MWGGFDLFLLPSRVPNSSNKACQNYQQTYDKGEPQGSQEQTYG